MKKLRTLNPKRLAEDFNDLHTDPPHEQTTQTVTPAPCHTIEVAPNPSLDDTSRLQSFKHNLLSQNNRLAHLEEMILKQLIHRS